LDREMNLRDFREVLEIVLERADFRTDLYIFSNLSMDTLDYTGPKVNEGSKGVLLGVGDPIRELPGEFRGDTPAGVRSAHVFGRGCVVVDGPSYQEDPKFARIVASSTAFASWPLVILVDNARHAVRSTMDFLWTTFTRFEPGADIISRSATIERNHI